MWNTVTLSLTDLLGADYMGAVRRCAEVLYGMDPAEARRLACEPVEFYPPAAQARQDALLSHVGESLVPPFANDNCGAPTRSFARASRLDAAPLGGTDIFRLGEDGRLYLAAKSEHYHSSLGHSFPGYRLLDRARALGIPNATHNNTRGYITRLLERELLRCANGLAPGDEAGLRSILDSTEARVLNRVINLETGSLAVEAGIKMMLARFYRLEGGFPAPTGSGRIPVFLVMADRQGGTQANYHGTTIVAQTLRGLWPEFAAGAAAQGLYRVVGVGINDPADFRAKIEAYNRGPYRTAGFLHEIVLMNYGGIRLEEDYLRTAYELCRAHDTPVLVDEIQSCMWYPGLLLYRLCGLRPDFAVLGKGFSGGEYPASKILTTCGMDSLNQFGALVTNGQEELASLSYLITMAFVQANGEALARLGAYFTAGLMALAADFPALIEGVAGRGHLAAIHFRTLDLAVQFARILNEQCIDVSAQTYKADCPPAVLVKPPVITGTVAMDFLFSRMRGALEQLT